MAKAWKTAKIWIPEERWHSRPETRLEQEEEQEEGAEPVHRALTSLGQGAPGVEGQWREGAVRNTALSRLPRLYMLDLSVCLYSLGNSCHQRFKFQDVRSDVPKVTFYLIDLLLVHGVSWGMKWRARDQRRGEQREAKSCSRTVGRAFQLA